MIGRLMQVIDGGRRTSLGDVTLTRIPIKGELLQYHRADTLQKHYYEVLGVLHIVPLSIGAAKQADPPEIWVRECGEGDLCERLGINV